MSSVSSSSSPSKAQSTMAGSSVGGLNALSAMRAHEEQIAQRIQQLEATKNDPNLGIVARTKAKVELALLKNNDDEILALRREEIDTLTQNIDVSKNTRVAEGRIKSNQERVDKDHAIANHLQELHKLALNRQEEARERAEHARIRAIEAEAYVADCEEEAQALIAQAKAAMTKLNEARVRAGEERRLQQEAQAAEEFQIQEIERLVKRGGEEKKGEDSSTAQEGGELEGGASTVVSKLTFNESQLDASVVDDDGEDDDEDDTKLGLDISYEDELKAVASSFDDRDGHITTHQHDLKYWMDKVASLQEEIKMLEANSEESNTMAARQADKIASLEKHLESGGQSQEYWEEQAAKLSEELCEVEQTRIEQELELQVLQKKFDKEDTQLQFLKKEIKDLRSMKLLLELKLVNVGEKEKTKLQALKEEIEGILKERESSLEAVRLTQIKYEKRITEREDEIATLQRDMDNHSMELKQAQALLEEKEAQVTMLQAKQTFEEGENNSKSSNGGESSSLPLANQNEYKKLKLQLKESKTQLTKLEEINEEYSTTIAKQKKKLGKNGDKMKEAFMVQDKEIERLSSTVSDEKEKAGALSEELKHWKDQSSQYEKSIAERDEEIASLLRHMDDNIAEVNKTQSALKAKEGMAKKVATHYEKRIADRDENIASLQREADHNSLELKQAQALLKQKEGLVRKLEGNLARVQQAKQQTSKEGDNVEEEGQDEEVVQTLETLATRRLSDAAMQEEFMAELDHYKERVAMLEEINEDQKAILAKQNKKLAKKDQLKEAFMMQDKEIQRLSSSLATETLKAENFAEEAEHWKENATELSNNLTMLEQQRDMMKDNWIETENKLNKLEGQQQQPQSQQPSESRRSSSGLSPQMSPMMEEGEFKFVESDGGYPSFPSFSHDDDSSYVGSSSICASVDTGFEDRVENAALKELLTRALAERDKLAAENDKLKNPPKSESKDESKGESKDESKPVQSEESKKEISELRSKILELAEGKDKLDRKLRQLIDTVGSSNLKRHEYQARLRDVEGERRKLSKKLKVLLELADLHGGSEGGAADDKKKDKKKSRTQVYQLSCKQCKSDLDYIGKTKSELKYKVRDHFKDICQLVNQEQTGTNEDGTTKKMNDNEFAFSEFASHFARHCRNAQTPEEVLMWCADNMKVKRQKVMDDEDNAEDCVQRTVYQLSCKDCKSNLHYIGSTHQNLKRAVVKHYNEIWKIVDEEYGDGGYRKDADDVQRNKAGLSKFAHSAAHFAKHCRTAKSNSEVKKWCEDNIKVEKWAMVCKTCLGTSIDTVQPSKANTIMSYKVEEKFDPDAGKKS